MTERGQPAEKAMLDQQQAELATVRTELDTARAQVADLKKRLHQAEAAHRADRATWQAERVRLLALVEVLTAPPLGRLGRLGRLTRAVREWRPPYAAPHHRVTLIMTTRGRSWRSRWTVVGRGRGGLAAGTWRGAIFSSARRRPAAREDLPESLR